MRTLKLVNESSGCVEDAVEGMCLSNPNISRLKGLNVLVRSDIATIKDQQVTLISGGGSGHEPAHAGYIGEGMLAGAVLGNVFASPPVHAILAAIRVCAGKKGVLLIIKNYTGDRLNFGMALERARAEGFKVQMVVVDDDRALPPGKGITGARGVAGTIFVHKVAGAEAQRPGSTLESVSLLAETTISSLGSYGVALSLCTVPGSAPNNRLMGGNKMEVGLGIHAEPGDLRSVDPATASLSKDIVSEMLDKICGNSSEDLQEGNQDIAVMLNNLGGTSELEMLVVVKDLLSQLAERKFRVRRCYVGSFMTSLDMAGMSVTILRLERDPLNSLLPLLDSPTDVKAWKPSLELWGAAREEISHVTGEHAKPQGGGKCESACFKLLVQICHVLCSAEATLNEYDAICGDGDCGRVVHAAASRILQQVDEGLFPEEMDRATFCFEVAEAVSVAMGGTSGAITEIMMRAMASYFATNETSSSGWVGALSEGVEAIRTYGGADLGMRTLLDALIPAVSALSTSEIDQSMIAAAAKAATEGMESTKSMDSSAGRANYVPQEQMYGTPDPGAYAVHLIFEAVRDHFL